MLSGAESNKVVTINFHALFFGFGSNVACKKVRSKSSDRAAALIPQVNAFPGGPAATAAERQPQPQD